MKRAPRRPGTDRWGRHIQSIGEPRIRDRRCQQDRSAGLHAGAGERGGDRERGSPPPGPLDAGAVLPGCNADQLRAIYEQIAERLNSSYSLVYQSDRKIPDGTLRPVRISYRGSRKSAGETAVFIPGMVAPSGGWSPLFLGMLAALTVLIFLPGLLAGRKANA